MDKWKQMEFEYGERLRESGKETRRALYREAYNTVSRLAVDRFKSDRPEDRTAGTSRIHSFRYD